jgi:hypothetical protein
MVRATSDPVGIRSISDVELSKEELERHARHVSLRGFGAAGTNSLFHFLNASRYKHAVCMKYLFDMAFSSYGDRRVDRSYGNCWFADGRHGIPTDRYRFASQRRLHVLHTSPTDEDNVS